MVNMFSGRLPVKESLVGRGETRFEGTFVEFLRGNMMIEGRRGKVRSAIQHTARSIYTRAMTETSCRDYDV